MAKWKGFEHCWIVCIKACLVQNGNSHYNHNIATSNIARTTTTKNNSDSNSTTNNNNNNNNINKKKNNNNNNKNSSSPISPLRFRPGTKASPPLQTSTACRPKMRCQLHLFQMICLLVNLSNRPGRHWTETPRSNFILQAKPWACGSNNRKTPSTFVLPSLTLTKAWSRLSCLEFIFCFMRSNHHH